jgi:hypothetical protein
MKRWLAAALVVLSCVLAWGALTRAYLHAAPAGPVYSVPQFLAQVTARLPAHTPPRGHVYRVRGFLLSDVGPAQYALRVSPASMGIAVQAAPPGFAAILRRRVPALAPLLPHTADNPLLGQTATYRVAWAPCARYPRCPQTPWQTPWRLVSGGQ